MFTCFIAKYGFPENTDDEFEYEKKGNDDSFEMGKFFSCSDITHKDYLACETNVAFWHQKFRFRSDLIAQNQIFLLLRKMMMRNKNYFCDR